MGDFINRKGLMMVDMALLRPRFVGVFFIDSALPSLLFVLDASFIALLKVLLVSLVSIASCSGPNFTKRFS